MPTDLTPQSHKQLRLWVADRLRSEILEGRIKPGEWLRQERLALEQGVSQTPVREALKLLAGEGLVEHVPYRGIRVVEFSVEDVEDLYTCRAFIEGMAARYAAATITDTEIAELTRLYERMVRCKTPDDIVEYRELNRLFHSGIFGASGRSYLVRTLAQLWAAFPTMLWSNVPRVARDSVPDRDAPDIEEHTAILDALRAHDPDAAERAVRRHIEAAGGSLVAAMRVQG
ncbi:MAG: GntR family transcriptional regulator [Acidobacteria bacterium 21-70-11]|nr:MAG: GntR family transcriptional regulator [Acidobacteria bacterium 21-70-11]OYW06130.1 MAG: GntR family transcriptional regulator [Acidobacteria bacterium 37-71-11]HQT94359.1 GntR family transcriptional regulator [Thermoanaerobaculaceae bacterium]